MPKPTKPKDDEILVPSSPLSAQDERLDKLFDEMETNSLKTLEDAARQIITLSTALLGAFFGLLALKDTPDYLGFLEIKITARARCWPFSSRCSSRWWPSRPNATIFHAPA
jgi:hypothetical protein